MKQIFLIVTTMIFLASAGTCGEVTYNAEFSWTAVGDNDMEGIAHHYEIYYGDSANVINYTGIDFVSNLPAPQPPGTQEKVTKQLTLQDDTKIWFRLRVYDEAGNFTESNTVSLITPDKTAPGPIPLQIIFTEM